MNLHKEAQEIASEALRESQGDFDAAMDFIHESCDGHAISIYYGRAIDFCATNDTSEGEAWLEACDGIAQEGDTFGAIACRIAFATLLVAAQEALHEMESENA
jgi:hypothetical protein